MNLLPRRDRPRAPAGRASLAARLGAAQAALPAPARRAGLIVGLVALSALITQVALPSGTAGGRGVPIAVDFSGLEQGLFTALVAAGLILVYRSNRIVNFTAVALGVPAGVLAFNLIRFTSAPLVVTVLLVIVISAGTGAVVELAVARRFVKSSRLTFTVITIALLSLLTGQLAPLFDKAPFLPPLAERPEAELLTFNALQPYLPLRGLHFEIGSYPQRFYFGDLFAVELALVVLGLLALFLRVSRVGVGLRSAAENTERASLLGINVGSLSTLTWALAGGLAGVAILLQGVTGNTGVAFGSTSALDLLTPLTAAVLARFRSIPAALGYSVLLEVLIGAVNYAVADPQPVVLGGQLIILLVGLFAARRTLLRLERSEEGSWRLAREQPPVPRALRDLPGLRAAKVLSALVLLAAAVLLPFVVSPGTVTDFQGAFIVGIAGLSLVVLTGWAGQVSLGQYAFIAVGAVVAGGAADRGGLPFLVAVALGTLVSAGIAVVVGLPALRVRGLFLGVVTFALAAAASVALFDPTIFGWLLPVDVLRPSVFGISFDNETPFYFLCLAALLGAIGFVVHLRRSRVGRALIASRDNEAALRAAGISVVRTRLLAFAIAGAMAGFAGALLAFQLRGVAAASFGVTQSLNLFFYSVVGGVASVGGVLLGVALLEGLTFAPSSLLLTLLVGTGTLAIVYIFPGGITEALTGLRTAVLRIVAQRRGLVVPELYAEVDPEALANRLIPLAPGLAGTGLAALPAGLSYRGRSRIHGRAGVASGGASAREGAVLAAAAAGAASAAFEAALAAAAPGGSPSAPGGPPLAGGLPPGGRPEDTAPLPPIPPDAAVTVVSGVPTNGRATANGQAAHPEDLTEEIMSPIGNGRRP